MSELSVGDLVESAPGHALACGSGIYPHAVVVSLEPFALVSVEGDMLWTATQRPNTVRRLGPAPDTKAAFARWEKEKPQRMRFRVVKYVPAAESLVKLGFAYVSDGVWSIDVYSARPELPENREEIMRLAQRIADGLNA